MAKRSWDEPGNLTCTAPRCRKYVKMGDGLQWVDEDGDLQRYCLKHYKDLFKEPEDVADASAATQEGNIKPPDHPTASGEMLQPPSGDPGKLPEAQQ